MKALIAAILLSMTTSFYVEAAKVYQPPRTGGVWDCPVDGVTHTINENFAQVSNGDKDMDLSALSAMGRFVWSDQRGDRVTITIDKNGRGILSHRGKESPIKCQWQGTGRMPG